MSYRTQSLPIPVIPRKEVNSIETNTNPLNSIALINTEKKKKPHNISFKNFNPNEPKIYHINTNTVINRNIEDIKQKLNLNYLIKLWLMMKKN